MIFAMALWGSPVPVQAANNNISGAQCQPDIGAGDPAPPLLVFSTDGVWNYGTTATTVVCNMARSPLAQPTTYAYTTLICGIPPFGIPRGETSLQ